MIHTVENDSDILNSITKFYKVMINIKWFRYHNNCYYNEQRRVYSFKKVNGTRSIHNAKSKVILILNIVIKFDKGIYQITGLNGMV